MLLRSVSLLVIGFGLAACARQHDNPQPESGANSAQRIENYMAFLASDALEGRESGTKGYDQAAAYVAERFAELGLLPAGDNQTYFQNVNLRRSRRDPNAVSLSAVDERGLSLGLQANVDYAVGGSILHGQSSVTAPVVFVGYGMVAPELGRDDYAGLDVEGKIVALLSRTPDGIQSEERAFYGSRKGKEASDRGAVGTISLETPTSEAIYSFKRLVTEGQLESANMSWVQPDGQVYTRAPNLRGRASLSRSGVEKVFALAPQPWSEVWAAAEQTGLTPTFELPMTMTIEQRSVIDDVNSANVLGIIEGSDPQLKNEVLVLSAHLDHIGISQTDEADRINNGALDNAAGIATLLETARSLLAGPRPRRSVLFFAVTAEEKGLLGSQYFAKHSTLPDHQLIGNINLDMPVLTYDFQDVIVFGGDRSSLRAAIESAAAQMGISVMPDPFPEQGIFTRADHFRFVEEGVPSVMLATGFANGGEAAWAEHFAKTYHRPADDMNNHLDFDAAAKFAALKTRIALQVANADVRPLWNQGDFFARQFDGPMAHEP